MCINFSPVLRGGGWEGGGEGRGGEGGVGGWGGEGGVGGWGGEGGGKTSPGEDTR